MTCCQGCPHWPGIASFGSPLGQVAELGAGQGLFEAHPAGVICSRALTADTLRGDGGGNSLVGKAGADLLEGRDGDDFFEGGDGNDFITIGSTKKHVIGYLQDFLFSPERARTEIKFLFPSALRSM